MPIQWLPLLAGPLALTLLLACGSAPIPPSQTTADTDREALIALYNATDGQNWIADHNWMTDAPIADWYGVEVDLQGRVVKLVLSGNRLSGEIPPDLSNLVNLRVLAFQGNRLNGKIPPELGRLTNLRLLWLDDNQLSGEIPPELGNLVKVQVLSLSSNRLSGEIPPELGNLVNLTRMFLGGNKLTGCVPMSLQDKAVTDLQNC